LVEILSAEDFVKCPTDDVILSILLQPYKSAMRIARPLAPATKATRRRRSYPSDGPAGAKRPVLRPIQEDEVEQLPTTQPSDNCTYWPPNPAFDPKRVLLHRMFFINEDKTKYVSVGYYSARDYQPLVEFGAIRRGGSKSLILADEQVAALADCLPSIRDSMCVGGDRVIIKCESGNFRLHTPRRHGSARLFVGTEYISLIQPDMDYLVRVFPILQQQLRDYISALPDVLSYVTSSLASTSFVEPQPNASTTINYARFVRACNFCVT